MYAKDCLNPLEMLEIICDRIALEIDFYNKAVAMNETVAAQKQHNVIYAMRSLLTEMHVHSYAIINESGAFECIGFDVRGHIYGFARGGKYDHNGVYQGTYFRFYQDIPEFAGMRLAEDYTTF